METHCHMPALQTSLSLPPACPDGGGCRSNSTSSPAGGEQGCQTEASALLRPQPGGQTHCGAGGDGGGGRNLPQCAQQSQRYIYNRVQWHTCQIYIIHLCTYTYIRMYIYDHLCVCMYIQYVCMYVCMHVHAVCMPICMLCIRIYCTYVCTTYTQY